MGDVQSGLGWRPCLVWLWDESLVLGGDVGCRVSGRQGGGCWIKLVLGLCWRGRCDLGGIHTSVFAHRAAMAETSCRMWRGWLQDIFFSEAKGSRAKRHMSASLDCNNGCGQSSSPTQASGDWVLAREGAGTAVARAPAKTRGSDLPWCFCVG